MIAHDRHMREAVVLGQIGHDQRFGSRQHMLTEAFFALEDTGRQTDPRLQPLPIGIDEGDGRVAGSQGPSGKAGDLVQFGFGFAAADPVSVECRDPSSFLLRS